MDISVFIFLLFGLQFFYWFIGRRASKGVSNKDDYFLAGKGVGVFPLMMTFLATQVGGGVVLGAAEEAYQYGWWTLFFPFGSALGLILLGLGVGRRLAMFQVSTVAEIFEVVYRSVNLRRIASMLSVVSLFMILVAQIIASNKFLVSLGMDNTVLFVAFWGIVIIYTTLGGLKAVISTDVAQAAFFSTIFLLCCGFVYYSNPSTSLMPVPQLDQFGQISSKLYGWLMMPICFMLIEQDMGQRCFAGDCPKTVSRSALFAGLLTMVVCVVPVFFGTFAKTLELEIPNGGSVLMTAIAATTNPWVTALVGCAILAAVVSTATSLINAISSNLSSDFQLPALKDVNVVGLAKVVTCVISVGAIFVAFYFDNIVDLLIQSYELSVSCLFIPVLFALFKRAGNGTSAWMAIAFGAAGFVCFRLYPIDFPRELASILLSLTGYGCGMVFARAPAPARYSEG